MHVPSVWRVQTQITSETIVCVRGKGDEKGEGGEQKDICEG
jgi:hypothetical protein